MSIASYLRNETSFATRKSRQDALRDAIVARDEHRALSVLEDEIGADLGA